jgi:hypothetical protein
MLQIVMSNPSPPAQVVAIGTGASQNTRRIVRLNGNHRLSEEDDVRLTARLCHRVLPIFADNSVDRGQVGFAKIREFMDHAFSLSKSCLNK